MYNVQYTERLESLQKVSHRGIAESLVLVFI